MGGSSPFYAFLLITTSLLSFSSTSETCLPMEKQALMDFKKDLKDPFGRLSSGINNADCCQWKGVVCSNKSGHVIQLHLENSDSVFISGFEHSHDGGDPKSALSGNINPSLQNLTHLHYLNLSQNDFDRIPIPSFLGSFKSLRYLDLSGAGFQGMIPYQLGNLSSLRTLNIGGYPSNLRTNNLQWLAGLSNLEYLYMTNVDLSAASNWLEKTNMIPSLVKLCLFDCHIIQISQLAHTNFSSLTVLDISGNDFGHFIPRWIFGLTTLVSLDLSGNSFEVPWPRGSWNLTSLHHLNLYDNSLNGSLPDDIFLLNNLISLNLGYNQFEGFLDEIWNWSSVTSLDLSDNKFYAFLPRLLSTLTALVSLVLSGNDFQGYIPSSIANISSLQYLDLSDNNISSSLPSELFTLKDLITLDATDNQLNGLIPSTIGNCTKLKVLRLSDNSLTTSKWLYNCTSLEVLELSGNALSGSIPSNLGKLSSLKSLDVSENKLIGTLPESLGQLSKLVKLYILDNLMEGIVSESHLDNLTSLWFFLASGNSLTLKVSASWIPRVQFKILDLGSWKLGPQFPTWFHFQKNLAVLNLSSTGISDTIPPWLFSSSIDYMDLSHNQFHGKHSNISEIVKGFYVHYSQTDSLPQLISHSLTYLGLSNNLFSGGISHFLCEVKNERQILEYLDLGGNSLSGEIPDCWMNYPSMERITLNSNNFTGSIPRSLINLEQLIHLDLGNNSLSGPIPSTL